MSDLISVKESERQINSLSFKFNRRIHRLGGKSHSIEDTRQEMWAAFCIARDKFDPEGGASFKTFLHRMIFWHMNRYIAVQFEKRHEEVIAAQIGESFDGDEGNFIHEPADPNALDIEQVLIEASSFRQSQKKLSPGAAKFIEVLLRAPDVMADDFLALNEKAKHARNLGVRYARPPRITSSIVFDIMGVTRPDRTLIMKELNAYIERTTA